MLAFSYLPIAFYLLMRSTAVLQVGIITSCETVRDGEVSTFTGIVYKVNVSSPCSSGPNRIMFQVRYPNELTEDLCVANLSSCNKTENDQGCSCVSEEADAYIFEVNFRFNKSKHEGSKLIVMSDCSPKLFGIFNSEPCDLKAPSAKAKAASSNTDGKSDSHKTCVSWIVVGAAVAAAVSAALM